MTTTKPTTSTQASFEILGELSAELVHELRNSLQVIATQAYLGRDNAARAQKSCGIIETHAAEAQGAIADVLSLADGGRLPTQATSLAEVRGLSRRDVDAQATFEDAGDTLPLRVHPRLFARALRLLYDNAIAVATSNGQDTVRVSTRVERQGDVTAVYVEDDGPGVPAHIQDTLFEPMVTARPGGTGLGLSLARRIANAHGGSLSFIKDDAQQKKGAVFCFTLPAERG